MRDSNQGRFQQQFRFLRHQFLQDGDLPYCNILSEQTVAQALTAIETFDIYGEFEYGTVSLYTRSPQVVRSITTALPTKNILQGKGLRDGSAANVTTPG